MELEFSKNYTILQEFSLYRYDCIYYTMEELKNLGLNCCDSATFKNNFGSRNFKVQYYNLFGETCSIDSRTMASEISESEKASKNFKFFYKFNQINQSKKEMIGIAFCEQYVLSFMDKLYCYSFIEDRDEKRDAILNDINMLASRISEFIDSNPENSEECQKQLSIRRNYEQFKKIIPSD